MTRADPTVTFVNASVTPYKPVLAAGGAIGAVATAQDCVRAHGAAPWLLSFRMVGALTDDRSPTEVTADAVAGLTAAAPWTAGATEVFVHPDDADLRAAVTAAGLLVRVPPDLADATRWSYGAGYPLSGRGVTMLARTAAGPCRAGCVAGHGCDRWSEIANVILIDAPGRTYGEIAVGVEVLRACAADGNLYGLPEVAGPCARLVRLGLAPAAARQAVNLDRALARLYADGARPGARGPASVMRAMLRELCELLPADADAPAEPVPPGAGAARAGPVPADVAGVPPEPGPAGAGGVLTGLDPRTAGLVVAERARRTGDATRRTAAAVAHARRRSRRGAAPSAADLRSTFGLTAAEATAVLCEAAADPPDR